MSRFRKESPEAPNISKSQWLTINEYALQVRRAYSTVHGWIYNGTLDSLGIKYRHNGTRWMIFYS